jgi:hypothetical protein
MEYPLLLAIDKKTFGVPYFRPADDPTSRSYIDLDAHPEEISLLPEVQGWPELEAALKRFVDPSCKFRTLGCGVFIYPATDGSERVKLVSYISFCHRSMSLNNNIASYFSVFYGFSTFLSKKTLPDALQIYFVIKSTVFNGGKVGVGWSVDVGITSIANSIDEARTLPNVAFDLLTDFLIGEGRQV